MSRFSISTERLEIETSNEKTLQKDKKLFGWRIAKIAKSDKSRTKALMQLFG